MRVPLPTTLACALITPLLAFARGPSQPPTVDRNSDAIRAVLAEPLAKDPHPLLVAREKLRLAADEKAAQAIDLYLTTVAVREVFGEATEPKGTVAEVVEGRSGSLEMEALKHRVLDGTLRVERASAPRHEPSSGLIEVPIHIRNISARRVTASEFNVVIGPEGARTLRLRCDEGGPIDAHSTVVRTCTTNSRIVPVGQLEGYLTAPDYLGIAASRIQFDEPNLSANSEKVLWFAPAGSAPYDQARRDLEALDCRARGTCIREAIPTLDSNPMLWFAGVFACAGLVAGAIIARVARRRWDWGVIVAGVVGGGIIAGLVAALVANSVIAFLVMIYGPAAFGGFVLGLVSMLVLVRRGHPERTP